MQFSTLMATTLAVLLGSTDAWIVNILDHHANCNPQEGTRIRQIYSRTQECLTFGRDWGHVSTECSEFKWVNGRPDGPHGCITDNTDEYPYTLYPFAVDWLRRDSGKETKCTFYYGADCSGGEVQSNGGSRTCMDEYFNHNNVPVKNHMRIQSFRCTDPEMNEECLADARPGC
ncbi:hypothetical protein F66182_4385 [Fusarium sp. NRRL 66182]|nr:hypothetical protein F66182_4385 [Fusarium sp. NRRL 66182]